MEQYYRLFTSYRLPGIDRDKLIDSRTSLMLEPEHIIVICRNQMFVLDVIVNFTRLSDDQLYHQLKRIKTQAEEDEHSPAASAFANLGFLTSLPRNEWAQARNELMKDSTNRDGFADLFLPAEGKFIVYENSKGLNFSKTTELPYQPRGSFTGRLWANSDLPSNSMRSTVIIPQPIFLDFNRDGRLDAAARIDERIYYFLSSKSPDGRHSP